MVVAFGKYQLLRKLGTGGMGEVFLARLAEAAPEQEERRVVVKRILPHLVENEEFLELFLGEARTAARLNHPNISQIFEFGDVEGSWYLAMEYLAGHDLRSVVQTAKAKRKPIPLGAACRIIADAAAGLDYAHKAKDPRGRALGIVHRDISPHNILVGYGGAVKLIDFGVAKAADRIASTEPGQLRGKYPYMSPEQVEGEPTDPRSDLFSLGVVAWELLTGKRLFKGDSDPATLALIVECKVKPPSEVQPAVPGELSAVAMKALAKNPADRFRDLAEFQQAIAAFAQADVAGYMRALYPHGDPGDEESTAGGSDPLRTRSRRASSAAQLAAPALFDAEPTVSVRVQHLLEKAGARRSSFPPQAPRFFGRAAELQVLGSHLDSGARVITLFGPAGTGKTCLACHFALTHPGRFGAAGGVWFCDLRFSRGVDDLCLQISRALEAPLDAGGPGEDPVAQVAAALAGRKELLLVLDGFDALLRFAPQTLLRWLGAAPDARFLITSREPLRLEGERRLEVAPLEPADAAHLFRDRALAARPALRQTLADEQAAADLMKQLERLPLAIELTAAWVAALTPSQLLQRLPRKFERSTLDGVVEWSWSLLSPWEQSALAQAAVFRGGFSLEAAEAVVDLSGIAGAPWVLDGVQSLRDRALVRAFEVGSGELRFALDPCIRDYALEKLTWLPVEAGARRRHAAYYLAEGAKWAEAARGPDPAPALQRLALERENLLVVFEDSMGDASAGPGAAQDALCAALALEPLAASRGPFGPMAAMLDAALAREDAGAVEPKITASALEARGQARAALGEPGPAAEDLGRALGLVRKLGAGDARGVIHLLSLSGAALADAGKLDEAERTISEAEAALASLDDAVLKATLSLCRGHLELALARAEAKRGHAEAARAAAEALTERIARVEALAAGSGPLRAAVRRLRGVLERAPGSAA